MASIGLVSPMVRHYRKIEALLGDDPEVTVIYDANEQEIKVYVQDGIKAQALSRLLIHSVDFGSVQINVIVIPANRKEEALEGAPECVLKAAFDGNPVVDCISVLNGVGDTPFVYVIFKKDVVQYYTDDLSDLFRVCSTLYEEIARDVFVMQAGVFYCTNIA